MGGWSDAARLATANSTAPLMHPFYSFCIHALLPAGSYGAPPPVYGFTDHHKPHSPEGKINLQAILHPWQQPQRGAGAADAGEGEGTLAQGISPLTGHDEGRIVLPLPVCVNDLDDATGSYGRPPVAYELDDKHKARQA
jgi:hypothetical protein